MNNEQITCLNPLFCFIFDIQYWISIIVLKLHVCTLPMHMLLQKCKI